MNTEEYYSRHERLKSLYGSLCSNDPHFYQICGTKLGGKVTNGELLCEFYLCLKKSYYRKSSYLYSSRDFHQLNGECYVNCENTDINKEGCDERVALTNGQLVKPDHICNDVCDQMTCIDEAICNGYIYGIYCYRRFNSNRPDYLAPNLICNDRKDCYNNEDEADCTVTNTTEISCWRFQENRQVAVQNFTRCLPIGFEDFTKYCRSKDLVKQHINCTDPSRVGVGCEINGYQSTVSRYFICYNDKITACDDKIDSKCLNTRSCRVHKHAMCDNKEDCVDLADENHPDCRSKTKATCKRRVGNMGELPIPIAWLNDGVWDCQNGADETENWPTCGQGKTLRFVSSSETECENVFLCKTGNDGYVELHNLCDGF